MVFFDFTFVFVQVICYLYRSVNFSVFSSNLRYKLYINDIDDFWNHFTHTGVCFNICFGNKGVVIFDFLI